MIFWKEQQGEAEREDKPPERSDAMAAGGYLSERALAGLKAYEYKPAGYTILDKLHTPFWNC